MRATIDKAGRVVTPASLRQQIGLTSGEMVVDGEVVRISPPGVRDFDDRARAA